jgi:hypothetical protein
MKKKSTLFIICFLSISSIFASGQGKEMTGLKAQVHQVAGTYKLVPTEYCGFNFSPIGLPVEYQVEGLTVTVDGVSYPAKNSNANLEIHKIAVDKDVLDQLALHNIAYIIKTTSKQVLNY